MSLELQIQQQLQHFMLNVKVGIQSAGITALYGNSGSGKTTLLRVIAGLTRGSAHIRWRQEVWQNEQLWLAPEQRPVGFVFQDARLLPHLNVKQNLDFAERRAKGPAL